MKTEILKFCMQKGLLLDKEVFDLFNNIEDIESTKLIIEKISKQVGKKIITRTLFDENKESIQEILSKLPQIKEEKLENLKIKLGLSIEISKRTLESINLDIKNDSNKDSNKDFNKKEIIKKELDNKVKITHMPLSLGRKIEVNDFVVYLKNRFIQLKNILQEHTELNNLVSINKITGNKQGISIIGMVYDKRITKNKNLLLEVEDFTGKIKILINKDKEELYKQAEDISLDSVIGFKGSGNRNILFVNDLVFPDSKLFQRKKSPLEEYALFIGDLHFGSKKFMEENFFKFIDYLNGKFPKTEEEVKKIKYLFIVGDLVTGVGVYPNQEKDLKIKDLEKQFIKIAEILGRIRKDIKIIISPGNHEGVRLMEPQPLYDEKYAWPIYDMENVFLTGNPAQVTIAATEEFSGFNILTYHGFSFPYYANTIPSLISSEAMNSPEKIMFYLLKNRHLAPAHNSVQHFPCKEDTHFIKTVPDIFVAGHTHKSAVSYYNNILVISVSSWEEKTDYQEKFGNTPDHGKVPMLNLKTREIKILDFE
jgi:DNA polymerase II small subunit